MALDDVVTKKVESLMGIHTPKQIADVLEISYDDVANRVKYIQIERKYGSYYSYIQKLNKSRRQRPENLVFGGLVKAGLRKLGKTQDWLADKLDKCQQTISDYTLGNVLPPEAIQTKTFKALGYPYKTVKELI